MIPSSRKEMEQFVAEATDSHMAIHWLEQGKCAYHPTADGKIYLEEREMMFAGPNAEKDLREFFKGAAICGERGVTLRGQGLQKLGPPIDPATGTFMPVPYSMLYAVY